ncbi:hypothetical protein R1sor_026674 [Riccia sorocarpa]|uniref:Uncharacterized protein n=1 Tax=Riccia sorocarpa TaxID=122646 RepID=A0ABD3GDS6_9MARC
MDAVVPNLKPIITSVRVVAVSSQPSSPVAAFEVDSKGCHKLKAKIFKCNSSKKIIPVATNLNLSVDEEVESPLAQSPRSAADSLSRCKCRKKLSFKSRRSTSLLQPTEVENHPTGKFTPTEIELEDPNPPEGSSSPEVLISRNPNNDDIAVFNGGNKIKGSKSCELKLAFENLKKKKHRSQELYPTSELQNCCLVILAPSPALGRGEPIRNLVLDGDISGRFLVLAVLALLLVGKVPAILGTTCLCLVLSHVQKFLSHNMTPLQRERLAASRDGSASPEFSRIRGSPAGSGDVQSSDYRNKVLIEGFLQKGKGRMMA